ncbi:MAG: hypothetical protein AUI14_15685 [Actinobacteria bacterium 13_2_20CM_2_71_6]|nr:MAG: hypothetical protein AUI14_15685 [Actinobacteria bacterium 13_2_20CM_2_71_6]
MAQDTLAPPRPAQHIDDISAARKYTVVILSILGGLALAVVWSAQLVDRQIGENVADNLLGYDASARVVGGGIAGAVFAFVAGLAGTFTACNIAGFSALGPMMDSGSTAGDRIRRALPPLGWLSAGLIVVAAGYGAVGAALGEQIPQLNTHTVGNNVPVRLVQSVVVFCLLGIAFTWLGLAALRLVPDPLGRLTARWPQAPTFVMGMLIGGFLVGRPYPLFFKLFQEAARSHNPLYGAATFVLTALGNIAVIAVLFLALSVGTGGRYQRWLAARPGRAATVTAAALIIGGAFMLFYWGVRLPAHFDYGWFPTIT